MAGRMMSKTGNLAGDLSMTALVAACMLVLSGPQRAIAAIAPAHGGAQCL